MKENKIKKSWMIKKSMIVRLACGLRCCGEWIGSVYGRRFLVPSRENFIVVENEDKRKLEREARKKISERKERKSSAGTRYQPRGIERVQRSFLFVSCRHSPWDERAGEKKQQNKNIGGGGGEENDETAKGISRRKERERKKEREEARKKKRITHTHTHTKKN